MANKLAEAYVEITGRDLSLKGALAKAETDVAKGTAGMTQKLQAFALKSAMIVAAAAAAIGASFIAIGKKGVDAWGEAEVAQNDLAASLQNTGDYTQALWDKLEGVALAIQAQTTAEDDAILSGMAVAHNLGVQADQLDLAARAAVGLAAKYKKIGDTENAFFLIGKAAAGNTTMLGRMGIKLDETLDAQGKLNQLLKIGADSYGLAEAKANTMQGRMEQLKNATGNLYESVGQLLAPAIAELSKRIIGAAEAAQKWIDSNKEAALVIAQGLLNAVVNTITAVKVWASAHVFAAAGIMMTVTAAKMLADQLTGNDDALKAHRKELYQWAKAGDDARKAVASGTMDLMKGGSKIKLDKLWSPAKIGVGDPGSDEEAAVKSASKADKEISDIERAAAIRRATAIRDEKDEIKKLEMERNDATAMEKSYVVRQAIFDDYAAQIEAKQAEIEKAQEAKDKEAADALKAIMADELAASENLATTRKRLSGDTWGAEIQDAKNAYQQELRQLDALGLKAEQTAQRKLDAEARYHLALKGIEEQRLADVKARAAEQVEASRDAASKRLALADDLSVKLMTLLHGQRAGEQLQADRKRAEEIEEINRTIGDMTQRAAALGAIDAEYADKQRQLYDEDMQRMIDAGKEWRAQARDRVGLTSLFAIRDTAVIAGARQKFAEPTKAPVTQADPKTLQLMQEQLNVLTGLYKSSREQVAVLTQ